VEELIFNTTENWARTDNLAQYILKEVPRYHPNDPRYLTFWREQKRRCIEGVWGQEFGKYAYFPGNLYFYGNFCTLVDTDKKTKETFKIRPFCHDLEREQAYAMLEARGFSGWEHDDEFTSNDLWFEYREEGIPDPEHCNYNLINSEGKLKRYLPPRENIRKLQDKPLGIPLIENEAKDNMILGSRGGGKSYFIALAGLLYFLCFDGANRYNLNEVKKRKIEVCLGSGDTDKSGELMSKIVDCMNEFAINEDLGVWGKQGDADWTPNPFYRDMSGPKNSGNKEKGGWRYNYKKKVNGRWVEGFGTQTALFHVCYSDKKKGGAEAAAGGRYNLSVWEETGLSENVQDGWNSNRATVKRNGIQFGIQWFLGTSGNIELIIPSKEMFTDPSSFNLLEFKDHWEQSGFIGFFIPAYMTYRQFKDENGNTDLKRSKEYWLKGYKKAHASDNPKTIRMYQMNYPAVPSHMWVSDKNYLFPYEEAAKREQELRVNNNYKKIGTPIKLAWDSSKQEGVAYEVDHSAEPFYEFPISNKRESLEGCIMMYEPPARVNGNIPNDMYIITHDPYVSDNLEDGESIGATHVFMNPKYIPAGFNGNFLVATYHGKALGGKRAYYENFEKLVAFYGNPIRGVWYEANRGEYLRSYFEKKSKLHLLCLRPQYAKGDSAQLKNVTQYGVVVGNKVAKVSMIDNTHDWLLEDTVYNGMNKKVIETFPCIFTIKQMMQYSLENGDNFDSISSLIIAPLAFQELTHHEIKKATRQKRNPLAFLSTNERQFGPIDNQVKTKQFHEKYG